MRNWRRGNQGERNEEAHKGKFREKGKMDEEVTLFPIRMLHDILVT